MQTRLISWLVAGCIIATHTTDNQCITEEKKKKTSKKDPCMWDVSWSVFGLHIFGVNMNLCKCVRSVCSIWWRRTQNGTPVTDHLLSKDMENMMFNIWLHSNQLQQPICKKRTTWSRLQHKVTLITPSSFHEVAKAFAVFAHICCHRLSSPGEKVWSDSRSKTGVSPGTKKTPGASYDDRITNLKSSPKLPY